MQEKYEAEILVKKIIKNFMARKSFREGCLHKGWSREGPEGNYCRKLHDPEIETFITSGQALIQNMNVGSMLAAI